MSGALEVILSGRQSTPWPQPFLHSAVIGILIKAKCIDVAVLKVAYGRLINEAIEKVMPDVNKKQLAEFIADNGMAAAAEGIKSGALMRHVTDPFERESWIKNFEQKAAAEDAHAAMGELGAILQGNTELTPCHWSVACIINIPIEPPKIICRLRVCYDILISLTYIIVP